MTFAVDRDLLALEPTLHRDVSWLAQTLALTTGTLTAGTLVLADPLPSGGGGVGPGHVVVVNRTPMEILSVPADDTLVVSLTRPDIAGAQIIPTDRTDVPVAIVTFQPQLALVHRQLLAMLGIFADIVPDAAPGVVTEASIVNPRDLTLVESLGVLHLIYSAVAAALPATSPAAQRAAMYRERFAQERWRARARIDLNNDNLADAERTLSVAHVLRA